MDLPMTNNCRTRCQKKRQKNDIVDIDELVGYIIVDIPAEGAKNIPQRNI